MSSTPSPLQSLFEGLRKHLANRHAARRAQQSALPAAARRTSPGGQA